MDYINLITNVGFPAAAAIYFCKRYELKCDELSKFYKDEFLNALRGLTSDMTEVKKDVQEIRKDFQEMKR